MRRETYRPSELAGRALAALAEARHIAESLRNPWPGFELERIPVALHGVEGGWLLAQHPNPPAGAQQVEWHPLVESDRVAFLPEPPVALARGEQTVLNVAGRPTACLPAGELGEAATPYARQALVLALWEETFRAFLRTKGRQEPKLTYRLRYPVDDARNNALGRLEGRILAEALEEVPEAELRRLALAFALVRRERRGQLEEDLIQYEREMERTLGLAGYVQARVLDHVARPGYRSHPLFTVVTGLAAFTGAEELWNETLGRLRQVNRRGDGAARDRFALTGMAIGRLLDRLSPDWRPQIGRGLHLDELLEEHVEFDGGNADEAAITWAEQRNNYLEIMEEERVFSRQVRERKNLMVEEVLQGDGTLLIVDISDLHQTGYDPAPSAERVNSGLFLHPERVSFSFGETILSFTGILVVEDRHTGLVEARIPAANFKLEGDGQAIQALRGAEFSEGLELALPGVQVRACEGSIQQMQGAIFVKVTR